MVAPVSIISQIPPPIVPALDKAGNLTPQWRRFLETLWLRTGGFNDLVSNAQPFSDILTAISNSGLTTDQIVYGTGPTSVGVTPLTAFGRTLIGGASDVAVRALLSLGSLALLSSINNGNWSGTALTVANGGTGATSAASARTNLGLVIGTNVQAFSSVLSTYAGITPSANVQSVLGAANYAAIRTLLGLGSLALLSTINGGNWSGTDLAVVDGGTGASTAAAARTNLDAAQTAGSSVANVTDTGYIGLPGNIQTGNYQLVSSDLGKAVYYTGAAGNTFTIPLVATSSWPFSGVVDIINVGSGALSIAPAASVTLTRSSTSATGTRTLAVSGWATAIMRGGDSWLIKGEGIT